ncbi:MULTISPECIES: polyhydroxyalkanoate depolymerase [Hyphobacterium]|uniref:Polyhydroxyalkanoate depolymerase n=1 Tax=Hyphobacterium vulgare TaxID=1736751 RepID=A0ABV6ZWT3_9PROT
MLYSMHEMTRLALTPWRAAANASRRVLRAPWNPVGETFAGRAAAAAADLFESVTRRYGKPDWMLPTTEIDGQTVKVTPETVWSSPWCDLVHFAREGAKPGDPKILLVAPMSGHYATLLRGTVETFLPNHEVYITDWIDARMVPLTEGRFDVSDYIDHVRQMITETGADTHVVAVCQPGPLVLAAVSLMAEDKDPARPASMTFMGSPIDARKSPTVPNKLAEEKPFEWFENNVIHTVPPPYPGALRRVYPGFLQLAGFMNMNWDKHVDAHWQYFSDLVEGDGEPVEKHREFYDEYLAVMDLTEEFYLQTIRLIFQEHALPRGELMHRGRLVNPAAITDVALMTVEGERDDISGIGQTQAAHDLCVNIPEAMRVDWVQPKVGHYGVFNGSRFRAEIAPRMGAFFREHASSGGTGKTKAA